MIDDLQTRLQSLLHKQEISEVLYRYCRGVDRGDADLVKSVFHEEGIVDFSLFQGRGVEFADWIVIFLKDFRQVRHQIGNVQIELEGDLAFCETYCLATVDDGKQLRTVLCRYLDRLELRHEVWRIAHRAVTNDIKRSDPVVTSGWDPAPTTGKRDRTDPVYRRR